MYYNNYVFKKIIQFLWSEQTDPGSSLPIMLAASGDGFPGFDLV